MSMDRAPARWPTRRVKVLEHQYGKPLGEILDELLYARDLTHEKTARRLGISPVTLWAWRKRLDGQVVANGHQPAPAAQAVEASA
jgi:hypothetical protein